MREKDYRLLIIFFLKRKCIICGEKDLYCLEIDHVKGDGNRERKEFGSHYYARIWQKIKEGSKDYQLLCSNCNTKKAHIEGEWQRKIPFIDENGKTIGYHEK